MSDSRAGFSLAAIRAAARAADGPIMLQIRSDADRARVLRALGPEARVEMVDSFLAAASGLATRVFDLAVLDPEPDRATEAALQPIASSTELVWVVAGRPEACALALSRGAHGALPLPLPESEALLKAHLRWLLGNRRTRARALALRALLNEHREDLQHAAPGLLDAVSDLLGDAAPPRVAVAGKPAPARYPELDGANLPDVLVLTLVEQDRVEARLAEARTRAPGAAVVVLDVAPSLERHNASLYGGARAYLPASLEEAVIHELVVRVGQRKQLEAAGRRLIEVMARFGVLEDPSATALPQDLDARFLADSTSTGGAVVPSGHEVLVVDDEVVVLTVLREALRRGGYRVTTAASAEQAIDLLKHKSFDLVLTDKNLTGASGLDVLRFAKTLNPPPAVVLITGYSSYDSAAEALEIGALDYIEKPIRDVELLRQRIRRALSRRDEQESRRSGREPVAGRARVLLVEVEDDKRKLLAGFLGRSYDVVAVASGDEALARLVEARFDVVLADRNLPGMSGLRVIEQAQRLLPHCASVLYTAYPSYQSVKEAFDVGVDAYLVRPSEDLKALEDKVAGALRGKGGIMLG